MAAVYQNDWIEPVLVKVSKCDLVESDYNYEANNSGISKNDVLTQVMNFMLYGILKEKPELDISLIYQNIEKLGLTYLNHEYIKDLFDEYQSDGSISLWQSENYDELSRKITDILGVCIKVENIVLNAKDYNILSCELLDLIKQMLPEGTKAIQEMIIECVMKDMSIQTDEHEICEGIYHEWHRQIREGGLYYE